MTDEELQNFLKNLASKPPEEQRGILSDIANFVKGPVANKVNEFVGKAKEALGLNDKKEDEEEEEDKKKEEQKKKGGSCGGGSSSSSSSSDSAGESGDGTSPSELGDIEFGGSNGLLGRLLGQVDDSTNQMCKKIYTVYRAIVKDYSCPIAQRDNVADQFTPQDDLVTMEKTVRDFLKLEGKIYDPESTNPRFFASEDWVQHYEKDKNVVLAALDQYKANILRMQHLYTIADNNSYSKLLTIPNQDCKEEFQTHILWTARALKDWGNNWFIKRNAYSSTPLFDEDFWVPGLTGQMVQWMKLGTYCEFNMRPIAIETMIRKVDLLEGVIDRLISKDTVDRVISQFVGLKEKLEQKADQKNDSVFTSKVIDSQMGKALGVTDTGVENQKPEGTVYIAPKEDAVEDVNLVCKMSCVKKLFQQLREKSLDAMWACRCVSSAGPGPYPQIWTRIDDLAEPVYTDLDVMNELIEDEYNDYESPGKHCSVTHAWMSPIQLKKKITAFKNIIKQGVIDVMVNQSMLPKKGKNILDSMFNQLWEYGEKGPTIEMPSWCQEAINSIDGFERSMLDAWSEVYDCWEREFITRLWNIEVDHHTSNHEKTQTRFAKTSHNHQHPFVPLTMMTLASIGGDTHFSFITPLKGVLTCPGHLEQLMKPVCIQYRIFNIAHLARNYRTDIKSLCQWMTAAIQAVGIRLASISAVMSDPTLNGECGNVAELDEINWLRERNHVLLKKVEHAYGIYYDVENMKNKKEYDEQIALQELQAKKYSNEDQLNMTSSLQSETNESGLDAELCQGGIDIGELKPWNHLDLSENKVEPKPIPSKCVCPKFDKIVKTLSGFESQMNLED